MLFTPKQSPLRVWIVPAIFGLIARAAVAQTVVGLPLTTGEAGKISLGFFATGAVQITASGTGDLVNSTFQTNPDGSLAAVAGGSYTFANNGAAYGSVSTFPAGDGFNHFTGGGANYDFTGSGWMFAGLQTTDTTNPSAIRAGAVVGTFAAIPSRTDWFFIGYSKLVTIPDGGATLYVAVNESVSHDNHGSYSLTYTAVPEPSVTVLVIGVAAAAAVGWRRARSKSAPRLISRCAG
jgi:hypothetical protein